ncbi:MAG TPA: competence/damage-inducible protein A [Gemmatimonadaceae bacterium]|nr:competence/damage-inducible protein A [Gemmatimonadaceae bacterium]
MKIELVTIGDELLLGFTIDTNAAHLARELAAIGVEIDRRTTVGDTAEAIAAAVRDGLDRAGAVITTGGLGPTSDDLTKPAIAALFGREMVFDEEHFAWMAERWRRRFDHEIPAANRLQAMIPAGARKLRNQHGSAPGIWLEDDRGRWVAMLPGVPREMRGMLADTLVPMLSERVAGDRVVRSRTLRTTGVAESLLADRVQPVAGALGRDVSLAYLPNVDGVDLRVTVRGLPAADADRVLEAAAAQLRPVVGTDAYGEGNADLAAVVLDACRARGLSIAVGESCTGGLLGERLTNIPGSSDVFVGGVIAYANEIKTSLLDVPAAMIREHGAVSEPVVRAMATGARNCTGAEVGIGITGVAGPDGGTPEKPVGTVWVGVDFAGEVRSVLLHSWGDRQEVRQRAAQAALNLVRRVLEVGPA